MTEEPGRFAQEVHRHREALHMFALRLTRNRADADDLVQETIMQALTRHASLNTEDKLSSWMMSIMHNLFIDRCRKKKTEMRALDRYRDVHTARVSADPEPPPRWASVTQEEVAIALRALSPKLREVYLCKVEGLSYDAIADRLGISTNTVGTRLMRARKALEKTLSRYLGEP